MTDATRRKRAKLSEVAVTGSAAAQSSTPRSKTLVVAVYNFKGGCGKTFLTRELAATAVKAGKRVGMVDIDPQCNLTSWWLPGTEPYMGDGVDTAKRRDSDDEEEDSGNESDDCEEAGEQVGAQGAAVAPQVQQHPLHLETELLSIEDIRSDNLPNNVHSHMTKAMSKPADFVSLELELTKIPSPGDGELWLLPGSRQVLQLESLLTTAQSTPDPGGLLGHYVGAFHAVLKRMSAQANLDIIFVDCSPSCGPLNKVAVMSCDFILPPAMVDASNLSSLHGLLTAVLPTWYQEHRQLRKCNNIGCLEDSEPKNGDVAIFRLPKKPPKLLPIVALNYALRKKNNDVTRVVHGKSQRIQQIRTLVMSVIEKSAEPSPVGSGFMAQQNHAGLKQVVESLLPERHGLETHYVWAVVRTLDAPLSASSNNRWPVTWSVDPHDVAFFKSNAVQRDQRHEITRNYKTINRDVLDRLLTVVNWIMSQSVN